MPYRLVVFDFDGTVADTSAAICEVANRTLERFGFARMPDTRIRQTLGLELPVIFEQLTEGVADAAKLDAMARAYRDGFDPVGLPGARLFDGVRPALERLRARGTRTGIATMRGMPSLASMRATCSTISSRARASCAASRIPRCSCTTWSTSE